MKRSIGAEVRHQTEIIYSEFEAVAAAGYDFALFMLDALIKLDEGQFKDFRRYMADAGLGAPELLCPFPNDIAVYSPEFDLKAYMDTLKLKYERAAEIGTEVVEFAQRLSRKLPVEIGPGIREYRAKMVDCIAVGAEVALSYGLRMSIKPTSRFSSNFCNSFGETVALIGEIGVPGMCIMADIHHMLNVGEPYENLYRYKEYIGHVMLREPFGEYPNAAPPSLEDEFDYDPFMATLRAMDYDGPITIEARTPNEYADDLQTALRFLAHYGYSPAQTGSRPSF